MSQHAVELEIPEADGTVRVSGGDRIFYKILLNDHPILRKRGTWTIPLKGGETGLLRARGFIPGFQRLFFEGREVFRMAGYVGTPERVAMSLPILYIALLYPGLAFPGVIVALLVFFMNIMAVKNLILPRAARIALPIANSVAGVFILLMLPALFGVELPSEPAG